MPSLMNVAEFRGKQPIRDPRLYFIDAYRPGWDSGWKFEIEKTYPHVLNIHHDVIEDLAYGYDNTFYIELRRFVERRCEGDVMYDYKNMSYKWWWNKDAKSDWERKYSDVQHGYWYFYFESENDKGMFALTHAEKLSKVQDYHPQFGKDVLEQDKVYGKVD